MALCTNCKTIFFGGVRDDNGHYCGNRCRDKAAANRQASAAQAARTQRANGDGNAIYKVEGVGGEMEVFDDKLTITPKGALGLMTKGLKGTKTIPFLSITGIQYKKPGMTNGYLQFTIPGGNESKGGVFAAASDENTFMFEAKANDVIVGVKDFIEKKVKEARQPAAAQPASAAEEIRKLAELMSQGLLSKEEFGNAKKKLLGL